MSFCDKCIDRTDIRIGDYWSAFEGSEEALPFFPKFNNLSVENTEYSNRFKIRVSNNGAFGLEYILTQGQYCSSLKRKYSIPFVLLKLLLGAYYAYFIYASVAFEYEANFDRYMECLFFIMIPITLFLALLYWTSFKYFRLVEKYVLKYKCEKEIPSYYASSRSFNDDSFDKTYDAVSKFDELFDEDHFLEFDSIDDSDDLCRGLKDLILDDADYDDNAYRSFVENLNIELIDITDNAAQVLYNSFGAFDVQYDEFALRFGQLLSETDVIHGSKYQKIYIAGGDLAKEHLGSLKQFMMLDKVYSIFLVVYPDETVVIGYGKFES